MTGGGQAAGIDDASPMSRMWPKLPAPAAAPPSLRERVATQQLRPGEDARSVAAVAAAEGEQPVDAAPQSVAALALATAEAPLSAAEKKRLNRVLAFQKRGEEKKRAAAAAAATSSGLRAELETLRPSQLRKRALSAGVSERELEGVEDSSDSSYLAFVDLIEERELRSAAAAGGSDNAGPGNAGKGASAGKLRLEPAAVAPSTPPTARRTSMSSGGSPGTLPDITLSAAEVQELCETVAAALGSFRHLCKDEGDGRATWLENERGLMRMLHERLRGCDAPEAEPATA